MPHANINGQDLYFEDHGGNGPAVIFSHGLLMDHAMFAPQLQALGSQYRVICWDERGHGKTGEAKAPFSYYDSAADLIGLLDHLNIRQAVLAGMSQGGYLSLRAALKYPERVRALILIDTQAMPEDPATLPVYTQMITTWAQEGLSAPMAATIEHIILGDGWSGAAEWKARWARVAPSTLQQIFTTLATRDDISEKISAIKVPALAIHGDMDNAIPLAHAQDMVKRLPNARMEVIAGAGHAANLTHPEKVNPLILGFLKTLS